ncbi:peptidoglycan-binding protein, partial [Micromonospora harpali]
MAAPGRSAARRVGQVLTGFGALVVLIAVLVGGPVALLAFAGNPLPDHLPSLAEVGATLTSRDDGQLFLRALALVGWFGWATFAFSVLVELGAQTLRRPAPRLPGMSRQQRAAAALVGSVALIIAASPAATSAATTLSGPYPAAAPAAVAGAPVARPVAALPVVDARAATPTA